MNSNFEAGGRRQGAGGNTDDRKPVPELTEDLIGKLFGDRLQLAIALYPHGLISSSEVQNGLSPLSNSRLVTYKIKRGK
ncbi:MAG: hypothetical protein QNJ33_03415 [Crocosphaera sp.]|nr:hypothetical protein [Crocosphaera sp.]